MAGANISTGQGKNSDGLALFLHAGLNYEESDKNGFSNFTRRLREEALGYDKPILMVYGDHHRFLIEKPLVDDEGKVLKKLYFANGFWGQGYACSRNSCRQGGKRTLSNQAVFCGR